MEWREAKLKALFTSAEPESRSNLALCLSLFVCRVSLLSFALVKALCALSAKPPVLK